MGKLITTLVVIGILVLSLIAVKILKPNAFSAQTVDEQGNVVSDNTIVVESSPDSITLNLNDLDKYKASNDPAGKLRIYSPDKGNTSDDGTATLARDSQYKGIVEFQSTTYYAQDVLIDTKNAKGNQLDYQPEVCKAGAPTITVHNKDGSVNSQTNPQALSADELTEVKVTVDAPANICFGSPDAEGTSVLTIGYNLTTIDGVEVDGFGKATKPKVFTNLNRTNDEDSYFIDNLLDGAEKEYTLIIDTDASTAPASDTNISLNFYDGNVDYDFTNNVVIKGIEDESDNSLSLSVVNTTIWIS